MKAGKGFGRCPNPFPLAIEKEERWDDSHDP